MADLTESATWEPGVFRLETNTPATGGPGGVMNTQAQQLANRTQWLRQQVEARVPLAGNATIAGAMTFSARMNLDGDYKEGVVTANTGTAYTINLATGTVQLLTLTGNASLTFPAANPAGRSFLLLLRQDTPGNRTVTWPANVRWPAGTAPTITATAGRTDKFVFTSDGANWLGTNAGQNYAA